MTWEVVTSDVEVVEPDVVGEAKNGLSSKKVTSAET